MSMTESIHALARFSLTTDSTFQPSLKHHTTTMAETPTEAACSTALRVTTISSVARTTTARAQVLNLPELVENILTFLPPLDIHNARRISKTWNYQYLNSAKVLQSAVLVPNTLTPKMVPAQSSVQGHTDQYHCCLPFYVVRYEIKLHNIFAYESEDQERRLFGVYYGESMVIPKLALTNRNYKANADDYATCPPCSTIGMELAIPGVQCVVYNPMGVLVRDIVETGVKLLGPEPRFIEEWGKLRLDFGSNAWARPGEETLGPASLCRCIIG